MVVLAAGIDIGIGLLLAAVLINYGKLKVQPKAVSAIGIGAVLFILAGVLSVANLGIVIPLVVDQIINVVAVIAVIIGTIWAACSLIPTKLSKK